MKILLAVDGSKSAERAAEALIEYAAQLREPPEIDVVFVHLPVRPVGTVHGVAVSSEALESYYKSEAYEALARCRELLANAKLTFEIRLLIGDPADAINRFAQEHGSQLIFMGTRGMSAIGNLLLGSTANKLLHLASVPVTLVPAEPLAKAALNLGPAMRT